MPASIPPWVPVLFLVLVFLGYRQSLPRTVKPATLVAVALAMFGLSLYGVLSAFGAEPLGFVAWVIGYAASVWFGVQRVSPRLEPAGIKVRVPGSWAPLALVLGIFAAKFTLGFATATQAPVLHQPSFITFMSLALGALSGGFGARAFAVQRCATMRGTA